MAVTETGHAAAREIDDLYRRHGGEVYRYALAVLGNHADAEDVTQTTFLNAYRSLEQGVRPRKPSNWLLTIASNAIKQRFRQDQARPRQVELDDRIADRTPEATGPTVGEILTALSRIAPQQRQAIVLREFEGRSYKEIAEILNVTVSALETLLFRARRSLAEELEHQLSCTEAQFAISQAADGRLGRKERRRLRVHLEECPDCAQFTQAQKRHRRALRGLVLVPIPVSLTLFRGFEGSATAATLPAFGAGTAVAVGSGGGAAGVVGGGALAGGVALKAAAVVTAAGVAGGVGVVGATEIESKAKSKPPAKVEKAGHRLGQTAPRGVLVPGRGVARGKTSAPGQTKRDEPRTSRPGTSTSTGSRGKKAEAAPGQRGRDAKILKNVEAEKRNSKRVAPQQNRVRPNLEAKKSRGKAVRPRKSPPSRSGKR
ncbi:MAG: sigma-70 family RNA polymerase sigma factor [Actinomycetota bacterium]|nr:sigma-70 family RNA polymerase sigma factor [Actinomycetota bacterium]